MRNTYTAPGIGHALAILLAVSCAAGADFPEEEAVRQRLGAFLNVEPEKLLPDEKTSPNLIFQTNVAYDPRVDLRADRVIVHRHGASMESVEEALQTWQAAGHEVIRMFFVSSDAGQHFEEGRVTGEPRPDVLEMTADGNILRIDGHRAYIFPDADWVEYVGGFIDHAIAHGAVGVTPEEPFGHAQTGYEEAYKRIWESRMGTAWVAPHASPENFWRSAQFKSRHFLDMIDQLARRNRTVAAQEGRGVQFILPIHSLLSNMAGGRIFPNVQSARLEHVDAWIAQVWQGPVLWALGNFAGERYDGFFESALGLYSTFAELCRDTDKTMYFLVDPVEDDPRRTWSIYKENYEKCVVAMLQFPWVEHYEVMPWPDRIFLPGYSMGAGTPGPSDYLTQLMAVMQVFNEMPGAELRPSSNDQGLGLLIADTASWEIHGPMGPGFNSFHGLYLPHATQGVLVRLPWLERADEPGYLKDFRVLLLSYDLQKPERPEIHEGLLQWMRDGGWLALVGGESAYNEVDGWWNRAGYASPAEALLNAAGVPVGAMPARPFTRINMMGEVFAPSRERHTLIFEGIPEDQVLARTDTGAVCAFSQPLGRGGLLALGTPAGWAAEEEAGIRMLRRAVGWAAMQSGAPLEPMNVVSIERGPWLAAYVMDGEASFDGLFVDIFDPDLPVLRTPVFSSGSAVLMKRIDPVGGDPQLLFATHRLVYEEARNNEFVLVLEGPGETLAAARICSPENQHRITSASALNAEGGMVPVIHKYDPDSRSSLIQFPYHPQGVAVRLRWDS